MVDGDDQHSLLQSVEGNLQQGVQSSVFRYTGLLNSDVVINESRTVGLDDQLDGTVTYRQPVQRNHRSNILLCGSSRTGKSLVNAVCQRVFESAGPQRDRFGVTRINYQTIRANDRAV